MVLAGEVADPANPPSGCYFHPRCRYKVDRCVTEAPILREITPEHFVSCHRAEELRLTGVFGLTASEPAQNGIGAANVTVSAHASEAIRSGSPEQHEQA
jgi:hypothetical protein